MVCRPCLCFAGDKVAVGYNKTNVDQEEVVKEEEQEPGRP